MQSHESNASHITLACFQVGGDSYALDVTQLREVVRWQTITPLPRAPELIEGVIDLRGAIVPVVDLGRLLLGTRVVPGARARIAIAEVDGLVLGLAVDAATEVIAADTAALVDPPALAAHAGYDAARAVLRRPDAPPILVIALDHVLECVYRSALPVEDAEAGAAPEAKPAGAARRIR
ncbi:MAG TPA: chemotaxis protein CheW [Myxococcota bacterium]|nr:chemotaxis protein CheW [Myxococcota bacterium]